MTSPEDPSDTVTDRLRRVSFPTIGHFLESGFMNSGIQSAHPVANVVGVARTVSVAGADASAVNRAIDALGRGDVLVIDTGGNRTHAHIGLVTATAAQAAGAVAIVVDGLSTDTRELAELGLPVFSRGTTLLTTKRLDRQGHSWGEPVVCGGVVVRDGDLVLGDDNGVLASPPEILGAVIDDVERSDALEPELLRRLSGLTQA
ncbi:RraA family protein [Rhodococcus opacus]|nr:RraA family protein [Rhodococcus opacus]RZL80767.1 MAG: RraA family protein [Rhodococcus sp. (in: high G+C Gram-positive bacteria)]